MSEQKKKNQPKAENPATENPATEKQGFFKRIVNKLDGAMKEKADQKSQEGSCCGSDGKGGKCC